MVPARKATSPPLRRPASGTSHTSCSTTGHRDFLGVASTSGRPAPTSSSRCNGKSSAAARPTPLADSAPPPQRHRPRSRDGHSLEAHARPVAACRRTRPRSAAAPPSPPPPSDARSALDSTDGSTPTHTGTHGTSPPVSFDLTRSMHACDPPQSRDSNPAQRHRRRGTRAAVPTDRSLPRVAGGKRPMLRPKQLSALGAVGGTVRAPRLRQSGAPPASPVTRDQRSAGGRPARARRC